MMGMEGLPALLFGSEQNARGRLHLRITSSWDDPKEVHVRHPSRIQVSVCMKPCMQDSGRPICGQTQVGPQEARGSSAACVSEV